MGFYRSLGVLAFSLYSVVLGCESEPYPYVRMLDRPKDICLEFVCTNGEMVG
tara:strand:+ start:2365 stop:2520 length:156 start_codon:yes stop_codon:yes gene_type:complete